MNELKARATAPRAGATWRRGRQYVANWEMETEQITSPELRAGAEQRRCRVEAELRPDHGDGGGGAGLVPAVPARPPGHPAALASDLTPAGIDSAKPAMEKAKANGETLQQRLDTLIAQLDEVGGSMSSSAGQASGTQK